MGGQRLEIRPKKSVPVHAERSANVDFAKTSGEYPCQSATAHAQGRVSLKPHPHLHLMDPPVSFLNRVVSQAFTSEVLKNGNKNKIK